MKRDIVVLAGSAPHSVLALCKMGAEMHVKTYVVCIDDGFEYYDAADIVSECQMVKVAELDSFWEVFFRSHEFDEKPVLYPTTDATCLLVNGNRSFYESHFYVCLSSDYIVSSYNDKAIADIAAKRCGLQVPKTEVVKNLYDLEAIRSDFNFPVIAKPQGAVFLEEVGFKFRIYETPEQLMDAKEVFERGYQLIVQEFIPGEDDDYSFYLFYRGKDGTIHDCMGVKTLQYNGIMAIGTVKRDDILAGICREFISKIDYIGIGGIEFKRYKGKYYFIEMSTRTEGFLAIALMSGSSLIRASYLDSIEESTKVREAKEKTVYVDTFFWILKRIREKSYFLWIKELIQFTFSRRTHFAGLYLDRKFSMKRYALLVTHK